MRRKSTIVTGGSTPCDRSQISSYPSLANRLGLHVGCQLKSDRWSSPVQVDTCELPVLASRLPVMSANDSQYRLYGIRSKLFKFHFGSILRIGGFPWRPAFVPLESPNPPRSGLQKPHEHVFWLKFFQQAKLLCEPDTPGYLNIKPVGADSILNPRPSPVNVWRAQSENRPPPIGCRETSYPRSAPAEWSSSVMAPPHHLAPAPAATDTPVPNLRRPGPAPASRPAPLGHATLARPGWSGL